MASDEGSEKNVAKVRTPVSSDQILCSSFYEKTMENSIYEIMNAYAENTDLIHLVGLSLLANIDGKFILCILYVCILCVT